MSDRREIGMPPVGYVEFEDAESGDHLIVNTSDRQVQRGLDEHAARLSADREQAFRKARVDVIEVETGEPYFDSLRRFFKQRARRYR